MKLSNDIKIIGMFEWNALAEIIQSYKDVIEIIDSNLLSFPDLTLKEIQNSISRQ